MRINVNDQVYISEISTEDKEDYIEHFKERKIFENTLAIPFPYGDREADWWINAVQEETRRFGTPLNLAIRTTEGQLIGGIGLMSMTSRNDHAAEIGYWLAKSYWNKGIMTNCIKKFCKWVFKESGFEIVRIQARVFANNEASTKVLLKAGFEPEGYMRKRFFKEGNYIDARLYALIR